MTRALAESCYKAGRRPLKFIEIGHAPGRYKRPIYMATYLGSNLGTVSYERRWTFLLPMSTGSMMARFSEEEMVQISAFIATRPIYYSGKIYSRKSRR